MEVFIYTIIVTGLGQWEQRVSLSGWRIVSWLVASGSIRQLSLKSLGGDSR
jgi:hypothetical protein